MQGDSVMLHEPTPCCCMVCGTPSSLQCLGTWSSWPHTHVCVNRAIEHCVSVLRLLSVQRLSCVCVCVCVCVQEKPAKKAKAEKGAKEEVSDDTHTHTKHNT